MANKTIVAKEISELGPVLYELAQRYTSIDLQSYEAGDWCVSAIRSEDIESGSSAGVRARGCGPNLLAAMLAALGRPMGKKCSNKACVELRGVQGFDQFAQSKKRPDGKDNVCRTCRRRSYAARKMATAARVSSE